jgi:hypothetical protein
MPSSAEGEVEAVERGSCPVRITFGDCEGIGAINDLMFFVRSGYFR